MTRSRAGVPRIIRGWIYGAETEDRGEKYYLVVSNNRRNARLPTFLAVRLATTRKPALPSIVQLTDADTPWAGAILADDIDKVYPDEITRDYGALLPETMRRVDEALRVRPSPVGIARNRSAHPLRLAAGGPVSVRGGVVTGMWHRAPLMAFDLELSRLP